MLAKFPYDNGVVIQVPEGHEFSQKFCSREPHEVKFRKIVTSFYKLGFIDRTRGIIDLGAWIGDNSIPWAVNISGTVYAIDPGPMNCKFISQTARLNDIRNIDVIERAISKNGELLSYYWGLHHTSFHSADSHQNKMQSTSLDQLYRDGQISNVGMIHLDVEGMEWDVVKGAESLIRAEKPIIFYEQHVDSDDVNGLASHLFDLGYSSFLINEILVGCNPDCRNLVAILKGDSHQLTHISNDVGEPDLFTQIK